MKIRKLIFLVYVFLGFGLLELQAQQKQINEAAFDAAYLEKLIKVKIDSVRGRLKLKAFDTDPLLQKAAKDHAVYLAKNRTLTHFQEGDKKKFNPQDRVVFFGGKGYQTGENAAEHPVKVLLYKSKGQTIDRVNTYEQSATLFVQQWVNSPDHFKNLSKKEYERTGIAVAFDKKENRIYAVQVFSPHPKVN